MLSQKIQSSVNFQGINTVNGKKQIVEKKLDELKFTALATGLALISLLPENYFLKTFSTSQDGNGTITYKFSLDDENQSKAHIDIHPDGTADLLILNEKHNPEMPEDGYRINTSESGIPNGLVSFVLDQLNLIKDCFGQK